MSAVHTAALLGENVEDAIGFGWQLPERAGLKHDWEKLVGAVHVRVSY